MKKYNSIILSFLLVCISCNYIFPKQEKSPKEKLFPFLWITLATCYTGTPKVKSVSYIDNRDGTVTANMLYDMDRPNCVSLPKSEVRSVLIKKCMQGQVYQKDQNNCRGKGSEADGWGAEKYQYCPTNDRSCEKETGDRLRRYVADETKSPAAIACAQETFLGKRWGLPEGYEVFTEGGVWRLIFLWKYLIIKIQALVRHQSIHLAQLFLSAIRVMKLKLKVLVLDLLKGKSVLEQVLIKMNFTLFFAFQRKRRLQMKNFILALIFLTPLLLQSFPGDHNSITCRETFPNTDILKFIKKKSDGANVKLEDMNNRALEKVIDQDAIKIKHEKPIFFTMWGDSLSDLVRVYGFIEPQFFGFGPPSGGVMGSFGGFPLIFDTFDDYFGIYRMHIQEKDKIQNQGVSMRTTDGILWALNTNIASSTDNLRMPDLFPSNATNGHCAQIDSSSRSVMMIGGNDVMYGSLTSIMPFLNTFVLDNTTENTKKREAF